MKPIPERTRVARYMGGGQVEIVEEARAPLPEGGLLVASEACGLCSGELMDWYMDQKVPHVLGHEVAGRVLASDDARFPVGSRVFPHHHAPCGQCAHCWSGRPVHCETWRRTKLVPGGMAEIFAVPKANLADTLCVNDLRPEDAALIEPLACVVKSIAAAKEDGSASAAVVGLGVMGLMHMALLGDRAVGYDILPERREWANAQGWRTGDPAKPDRVETVFVCPGSQTAFEAALDLVVPGGTIVMFAPLPPGQALQVPQEVYFRDLTIAHAYSCGPSETAAAAEAIRGGRLRAEHVVSDFVRLEELPAAYGKMKRAEVLKVMVRFD